MNKKVKIWITDRQARDLATEFPELDATESDRLSLIITELRRFFDRYKRLPKYSDRKNGKLLPLITQLVRLRSAYKNNKLTAYQIREAELTPGWSWDKRADRSRFRGICYLNSFFKREGHVRVPRSHVENGFSLGAWYHSCRSNHKTHYISETLLVELRKFPGWGVNIHQEIRDGRLSDFCSFIKSNGALPSVKSSLGSWLAKQRNDFRSGKILGATKKKLDAVYPGWENAKLLNFNKSALVIGIKKYIYEYENSAIPCAYRTENNYALGRCVANLRHRYWSGALKSSVIERYNTIKGWSWGHTPKVRDTITDADIVSMRLDGASFERIAEILNFKVSTIVRICRIWKRRAERGAATVGHKLKTRILNNPDVLTLEHKHNRVTESRLQELIAYKKDGNKRLPAITRGLGNWLAQKRCLHKQARLSSAIKTSLDAIWPGWDNALPRGNTFRWLGNADRHVRDLIAHIKRHGKVAIPVRTKLGMWLSKQRSALKSGTLPNEVKDSLDRVWPEWGVVTLKLSEDQVLEIRNLWVTKRPNQSDLAEQFSVSLSYIRKIIRGVMRKIA